MSNPLGVFGELPVDLLSSVCRHLPISDVVTVSKLDRFLKTHVTRFIYREIKGLRVEIHDEHSTIYFIYKDGRVTDLDMEKDSWEDVVKAAKCVEKLDISCVSGKSTTQLFRCLESAHFNLRSLKVKIVGGSLVNEVNLRKRFLAVVTKHRSTLRHLEVTTTREQNVSLIANSSASSIILTYNQPLEEEENDSGESSTNYFFVNAMFDEFLTYHPITNVTLQVSSRFSAALALQKAYTIATPYRNRAILERLTIEFGNSLKDVTEKDMKDLIFQHIYDNHMQTPNLQNFHCTLPHDEIDLSQEFIASLNDSVRNHRKKSNRPFNSSLSFRAVRCQ